MHDGYWRPDGPTLPVEFARISPRDRLTLVLESDAQPIVVLWSKMKVDLNAAIDSLTVREGCNNSEPIGFIDLERQQSRSRDNSVADRITEWATSKNYDQVIWTDLDVNFTDKALPPFSQDAALGYLRGLQDQTAAREYIQKAPPQVKTALRTRIEYELGWTPIRSSWSP